MADTIKVKAIATGYFGDKIREEGDEFEVPVTHPLDTKDEENNPTFATWFRPIDKAAMKKIVDAAAKAAANKKDVSDLV